MLKEYSKLVQFENLLSKPILLFSIFLLGNMKLKNSLHSSITLILLDLNNFIKTRVTAKSSDLTSFLATEKHSNPYSKIGMHLLINCRITSSDANDTKRY